MLESALFAFAALRIKRLNARVYVRITLTLKFETSSMHQNHRDSLQCAAVEVEAHRNAAIDNCYRFMGAFTGICAARRCISAVQ